MAKEPKRKRAEKHVPLTEQKWPTKTWLKRCAWCHKNLPKDQEVFGISIGLVPEVLEELERGSIQPLFLPKLNRALPMVIVTDDSPAKLDGKDAMFQMCSVACAEAVKNALNEGLGT